MHLITYVMTTALKDILSTTNVKIVDADFDIMLTIC